MDGIGYIHMIYEVDRKFKADFYFQHAHVYSISKNAYKEKNKEIFTERNIEGIIIPAQELSEYGYLAIDVSVDLKSYDSLNQGSAIIRPQLLAIQGILSFLTGMILIPSNAFSQQYFEVERHIAQKDHKNILISERKQLSTDLDRIFTKILSSSKQNQVLYYSLFERWRKALYLEAESEDSLAFTDEAVLAYIHILEVLSDEFKANLELSIKAERTQLIDQLTTLCKQDAQGTLTKINKMINRISNLQVSLKAKILQMLETMDLKNSRTEAVVTRFIEHRNAIAHGRKDIYQDSMVFPLLPFFSFIKDIEEESEIIKLLSATVVSKHFDLPIWKEQFSTLMLIEIAPFPQVKNFLAMQTYLSITLNDFFHGKVDGIRPDTLAFYFVRQKLKLADLEMAIGPLLNFRQLDETACRALFDVAVPLTDSTLPYIAQKAIEIIEATQDNDWGFYSNVRDVIKHHEYFGIKLIWFEKWLTRRATL